MALTAWTLDGKIVVDDSGRPIVCDHCPCPGAVAIPCTNCDPDKTPATVKIQFGGVADYTPPQPVIANRTCAEAHPTACADFWNNTTFELPQDEDGCHYHLYVLMPCGSPLQMVIVFTIFGDYYEIEVAGTAGNHVFFDKDKTSGDCEFEVTGNYPLDSATDPYYCDWSNATAEVV